MADTTPTGNRWIGIAAVGAVLAFILGSLGFLLVELYGRPTASELADRDLKRIATAVADFQDRQGIPPQSLMDVAATAKLPKQDPWGRPYIYVRSEHAWEIRSAGADGIPNNGDDQRTGGSLRLPRREAAVPR